MDFHNKRKPCIRQSNMTDSKISRHTGFDWKVGQREKRKKNSSRRPKQFGITRLNTSIKKTKTV